MSRNQRILIWVGVIAVFLVPLPGGGSVWFLNGLLFRIFDFINSNFLPENF